MTRFSMLSKLMDRAEPSNSDERIEQNISRRFLGRFNLYAIVLCKHDNQEFISYMSQNFEKLDKRTGRNLLFFSLAEPGITTEIQRMSWKPEVAMMDVDKYPIDEDIYLYALTEALKISKRDLPSIIITNSLESSNCYDIKNSV